MDHSARPHSFPALTSVAAKSPPSSSSSNTGVSILHSISLESIDPTTFRSKHLWTPYGARGVFGGQIIAQALRAAGETLGEEGEGEGRWGLHSQHCYFLLSVDANIPVIYRVDKLRDGRSYKTRQVTATQLGLPIFILSCSYTLPPPPHAPNPSFSVPIPINVPGPEELLLEEERWEKFLSSERGRGEGVGMEGRRGLEAYCRERRESPIAIKEVPRHALMQFPTTNNDPDNSSTNGKPRERRMENHERMLWMKTRDESVKGEGGNVQKCIMAYISDFQFIGTAAHSVGLSHASKPRLGMLASLDHVVYWYSTSFKTTDWLLHVIHAPRTGEGRGVVHGRFYTREGELIAVTVQEGVVRAEMDKAKGGEEGRGKGKL